MPKQIIWQKADNVSQGKSKSKQAENRKKSEVITVKKDRLQEGVLPNETKKWKLGGSRRKIETPKRPPMKETTKPLDKLTHQKINVARESYYPLRDLVNKIKNRSRKEEGGQKLSCDKEFNDATARKTSKIKKFSDFETIRVINSSGSDSSEDSVLDFPQEFWLENSSESVNSFIETGKRGSKGWTSPLEDDWAFSDKLFLSK